jgi:chromosome segregation ATPase
MSNPFSPRRPQRSRFLQVAEYASVAASAVGVVASALSQQVVYAAAPLSLSLCLNLVNRRRFEQQTQHRLNDTIAALDQRILELPLPNYADLTQRVAQLQEQLSAIEQYQTEQTTQQTEGRSQLAQIYEQLTALQQLSDELTIVRQRQTTATNDQTEVRSQLAQLYQQLIALQQRQNEVATYQAEVQWLSRI